MNKTKITLKVLLIVLLALINNYTYPAYAYTNNITNNLTSIKKFNEPDILANNYYDLKKMGDLYCDKGNLGKAIFYYNKIIKLNKNEKDLNKLGQIYYIVGDYKNALKCFESAYELNPKNERTQVKIQITKNQLEKIKEEEKVNQLEPKEKAPKKIHSLIKAEGRLKDKISEEKLNKIIDFIWSDPKGKFLLQNALMDRVEFYLEKNIKHSCMNHQEINQAQSFYGYNPTLKDIPIYYVHTIYIKESDICKFQAKTTTLEENKYSIMVVAHELCHLVKFKNYPKSYDTKQEELICYIVGYDIASNILRDTPLKKEEIKAYARLIYNRMKNCEYKNLDKEDDVALKFLNAGIGTPHYSLYYDITNLSFKKMKNDDELKNYIKTLNFEINKNYESVFHKKYINYFGILYLREDGLINIMPSSRSKYLIAPLREALFNIKIEQSLHPFPSNINYGIIPLIFSQNNKTIKLKIKTN